MASFKYMGMPETRYIRTSDGLHVAYQSVGQGPLDLLLLPFMGCIDVMWDEPSFAHVLHRLAGIGRLIAFDYRGQGASDAFPPAGLANLEAFEPYIDDVRVVLDEVDSNRVNVIAHGTGGGMGMLFTATYPERTSSLVLIDAWARTTRADDYPFGVEADALVHYGELLERNWGTGENIWFQAPSRVGDEHFRRWLARYERAGGGPATMLGQWRWNVDTDLRAVLPTIRVPTLVLHKSANRVLSVEHGRYLAEHIPDARLVVLEGSDNLFFSDTGDEVVDEIAQFVTGVAPVREPDRALATVLFTDIVGSTEHAATLGDKAWARLLDRHDHLVRQELDRHRGRQIHPTGDGLLATFDGPARAIRCAQAIADAIRSLGIEVRAGLHTGEVELRGEDIAGMAVHLAARVMGQAAAGEVMVSSSVPPLVVGSGIEFDDRGEYELKGIPGTWRLFAVAR